MHVGVPVSAVLGGGAWLTGGRGLDDPSVHVDWGAISFALVDVQSPVHFCQGSAKPVHLASDWRLTFLIYLYET